MGNKPLFLVSLLLLLTSASSVFSEHLTTALPPQHSRSHLPPAHAPTTHHHHHHVHPPAVSPAHAPHHHHVHPPPAVSPAHAPHHHHVHPPPAVSPAHAPHHHHHHNHNLAPSHAPVQPPAHAPMHGPVAQPPRARLPRSFVAVQGVVFCKSCMYAAGDDTLNNATTVLGATVKLHCLNTRYPIVVQWKTDKNGYFYITAPKNITSYGAHKCLVTLVTSPNPDCSKPSKLHFGVSGASLKPEKKFVDEHGNPFILYNVGPFAFEPKCPK